MCLNAPCATVQHSDDSVCWGPIRRSRDGLKIDRKLLKSWRAVSGETRSAPTCPALPNAHTTNTPQCPYATPPQRNPYQPSTCLQCTLNAPQHVVIPTPTAHEPINQCPSLPTRTHATHEPSNTCIHLHPIHMPRHYTQHARVQHTITPVRTCTHLYIQGHNQRERYPCKCPVYPCEGYTEARSRRSLCPGKGQHTEACEGHTEALHPEAFPYPLLTRL